MYLGSKETVGLCLLGISCKRNVKGHLFNPVMVAANLATLSESYVSLKSLCFSLFLVNPKSYTTVTMKVPVGMI